MPTHVTANAGVEVLTSLCLSLTLTDVTSKRAVCEGRWAEADVATPKHRSKSSCDKVDDGTQTKCAGSLAVKRSPTARKEDG